MKHKPLIINIIVAAFIFFVLFTLNEKVASRNKEIMQLEIENAKLEVAILDIKNINEELKLNYEQFKKENESVKSIDDYVKYGSYLRRFKELYEKETWTSDEREELMTLFRLILKDKKSTINYYMYLDESPDNTLVRLTNNGDIMFLSNSQLFELIEVSDGAFSDILKGYLSDRFIDNAEELFKSNYYTQKEHILLSRYIFAYDYGVSEFTDKLLAIYDSILENNDLEEGFIEYIDEEKDKALYMLGIE